MRFKTAALLASVWLASTGVALAQVDMGNEVSVNPVSGGGGVLLYPGGQYMRVVPRLLQPGQNPKGADVIHLHMPGKHPAHVARTRIASAAPAATTTAIPGYTPLGGSEPGAAASPPPPRPKRVAAPRPAPKPVAAAPQAHPSGDDGLAGVAGLTSGSLLPGAPAPAPAPAPAARLARAEPPPPATNAPASQEVLTPGLTKRSVILFAPQASDPAQSALGAIKFLAGDLNAAMTGPAARIQILAFGGAHGDKGSDARRLSLKRALAIRQVLIDDGVSAERIDVRAMGGADDSGPADRVDVYIKA